MAVNLRGVTTVLLPGTGSDDDYVYRAFSAALHDVGAVVVTPEPATRTPHRRLPRRVGQRGAHVADRGRRGVHRRGGGHGVGDCSSRARAVAVLAALPAWTGAPDTAPAAIAARHSASVLRRDGLASATAQMRAGSPPWLADELTRSWVGQWPALPDAMDAAADLRRAHVQRVGEAGGSHGVGGGDGRPCAPRRGRHGVGVRGAARGACARSRSTRWASTRRCWAPRAWRRCWRPMTRCTASAYRAEY